MRMFLPAFLFFWSSSAGAFALTPATEGDLERLSQIEELSSAEQERRKKIAALAGSILQQLGAQPGPDDLLPVSGEAAVSAENSPGQTPLSDPLLDRLRQQLVLDSHGDSAQALALEATLARLMQSPFARELSEEFLKEGAKVKVSFEHIDNSWVLEDAEGRKYLQGKGGNISQKDGIYHVALNEEHLKTDPYYQNVQAPAILGHELLGHALQQIKADKAGVGLAFKSWDDDETQAALVDWIMNVELSREQKQWNDSWMWNYLASPQKYHESLQMQSAYYAGTFNSSEMENPVPALQARLQRASNSLDGVANDVKSYEFWNKFIAHLISAHESKPESFKKLFLNIDDQLKTFLPQATTDLRKIEKSTKDLIHFYQSANGKARIEKWRDPAAQGFLKEIEQTLAARRAYLENLLKDRGTPASPPPTPPIQGQETWDQLQKMAEDDRATNPAHFPLP